MRPISRNSRPDSSRVSVPQEYAGTLHSLELKLVSHEATCSERWRQVGDTLARLERQIALLQERWWWLAISIAGGGISTAAALVWSRIA